MDYSERFKQCRLDAGLKQAAAAKLSGISQQAISAYENGSREPHMSAIIALARTYGVTLDYLCGLVDERDAVWHP